MFFLVPKRGTGGTAFDSAHPHPPLRSRMEVRVQLHVVVDKCNPVASSIMYFHPLARASLCDVFMCVGEVTGWAGLVPSWGFYVVEVD